MLTRVDLQAIGKIIDQRLDKKLDEKFDSINEFIAYAKPTLTSLVEFAKSAKEKLIKLEEFAEFGEKALTSLLDESQEHFEQKLPERVKKLEAIHPGGHHAS